MDDSLNINLCENCDHYDRDKRGNHIMNMHCLTCSPLEGYPNFVPRQGVGNAKAIEIDATVDMVNHPPHYKTKNGLETIDVIEAFTEDLNGIEAVCTANALKYICRWKNKNGKQDLEKAVWYINHLIEHLEK